MGFFCGSTAWLSQVQVAPVGAAEGGVTRIAGEARCAGARSRLAVLGRRHQDLHELIWRRDKGPFSAPGRAVVDGPQSECGFEAANTASRSVSVT